VRIGGRLEKCNVGHDAVAHGVANSSSKTPLKIKHSVKDDFAVAKSASDTVILIWFGARMGVAEGGASPLETFTNLLHFRLKFFVSFTQTKVEGR
jgi:hypothetical protein